jgi:hypothetical protein
MNGRLFYWPTCECCATVWLNLRNHSQALRCAPLGTEYEVALAEMASCTISSMPANATYRLRDRASQQLTPAKQEIGQPKQDIADATEPTGNHHAVRPRSPPLMPKAQFVGIA